MSKPYFKIRNTKTDKVYELKSSVFEDSYSMYFHEAGWELVEITANGSRVICGQSEAQGNISPARNDGEILEYKI